MVASHLTRHALGVVVALLIAACSSASGPALPSGCDPNPCGGGACSATLGCVQCAKDADCAGQSMYDADAPNQLTPTEICVEGTCGACRSDTECASGLCWPLDHICHPRCTQGSLTPFCDARCLDDGECVACADDADCSPYWCNTKTNACIFCRDDADCSNPKLPKCNSLGACAGCLTNADCPAATPVCDFGQLACRAICRSDADCDDALPRCDATSLACVACLSDADCASSTTGPYCNSEHCSACRTNADCPNNGQCDPQHGCTYDD